MIRSTSSQDDESVFLDEGQSPLTPTQSTPTCRFHVEEDSSTTNTDSGAGKANSFFAENYDHENLTTDITLDDELGVRQVQRRKSVSSRFRSVSKEST